MLSLVALTGHSGEKLGLPTHPNREMKGKRGRNRAAADRSESREGKGGEGAARIVMRQGWKVVSNRETAAMKYSSF